MPQLGTQNDPKFARKFAYTRARRRTWISKLKKCLSLKNER